MKLEREQKNSFPLITVPLRVGKVGGREIVQVGVNSDDTVWRK